MVIVSQNDEKILTSVLPQPQLRLEVKIVPFPSL